MNFSVVVTVLTPLVAVTVYTTSVELVSGNLPRMVPVVASIVTPLGRAGVILKSFKNASERAGIGSVVTSTYWYM